VLSFDTRTMTDERREALAWRIHNLPDFKLPKLTHWNYELCREHRNGWVETYFDLATQTEKSHTVFDRPPHGCRECGIHFRQHQRVSVPWMYLKKRGLLADTMGSGKLLANSEPVLTPEGWVENGVLEPGQHVIGSDGLPTEILGVFPQGEKDIFRVTFTDGSYSLAGAEHLWEVNTPDRKFHGRSALVLTTQEILDKGLQQSSGNNKWYIPMVKPVEFIQKNEQTLDPYTLGVLLGDGGFTGPGVTLSTDHEIVESLSLPQGVRSVLQAHKQVDYSSDFRLTGIIPYLREMGLFGGRSENKFIPESYRFTSSENRIALLQGLLDTDGTAAGSSSIEWGTVSPQLADDMEFLIGSLGGTFNRSEKDPVFTYRGESRIGQKFFRFHIALPSSITPFRLSRKLDQWLRPTKYEPTRAIVSIEFEKREEATCIKVAAPDSLYVTRDFIVTHNTTSAGGMVAMMLETGELADPRDGGVGRVIISPRAPALLQWYAELKRMMPTLNIAVAQGQRQTRIQSYMQDWQVLLIGPEMLLRDSEFLHRIPLAAYITDDVDSIRNPENRQAYEIKRLGRKADRFFIMTGTPLQKRLPELHSILDPIGGLEAFGSLDTFTKRHVRQDVVTDYDQNGRRTQKRVISGYKHLDEVKRKMAPMVLRRTAADLVDVTLPAIIPSDVMLELYPAQRAKYTQLQQNVLTIFKEEGTVTKHTTAMTNLHYGAQICGGLATLGEPDGPGTSVKMDWILDKLDGDLADEKVVIFANYKNSIRALHNRFGEAGIGHVIVSGDDSNKARRFASQERFWRDPNCRVLIGTKAIEQSLNLQVSRHLINMDMILNQARMNQLAGRIRRDGSAFQHVFVHNLLAQATQEERYMPLLRREAALADHIWDENSELFQSLDAMSLLNLITG
jgi:hypothetical protein